MWRPMRKSQALSGVNLEDIKICDNIILEF